MLKTLGFGFGRKASEFLLATFAAEALKPDTSVGAPNDVPITMGAIVPPSSPAMSGYRLGQLTGLFSGRLFNRAELVDTLSASVTLSDEALAMLAYEKWGVDCAKKLMGAWSLMVYCGRSKRFFAAISPTGQQALLYTQQSDGFYMASIFAGFKCVLGQSPALNLTKIYDSLILSQSLSQDTFYTGLYSLPAGHYCTFDGRSLKITRYFHVKDSIQPIRYRHLDDYDAHFLSLFETVIQSMLRPEDKVAAHLSGGLDSSSIAVMAAETLAKSSRPLTAYGASPVRPPKLPALSNWTLDDWPLMQDVATMNPSIDLKRYYYGDESLNIASVGPYFAAHLDKMLRNPDSAGWVFGMHEQARQDGISVLLGGFLGNFTISWAGRPWTLRRALSQLKAWSIYYARSLKGHDLSAFTLANPDWLRRHPNTVLPSFMQPKESYPLMLENFLSRGASDGQSVFQWMQHSSGMLVLDPSADVRILSFCLSVPQDVFKTAAGSRQLVRRSMVGKLPDSVRLNTKRGSQNALWLESLLDNLDYCVAMRDFAKHSSELGMLIDLPRFEVMLDELIRLKQTTDWSNLDVSRVTQHYRYAFSRALAVIGWVHERCQAPK